MSLDSSNGSRSVHDADPVLRRSDSAAGIYVHVPFCARRCPYCDFAVDVRTSIPHRGYADAVISEYRRRRQALVGRRVRTIYFGGGTPSLWDPAQLQRVLRVIEADHDGDLVEVCLEANPADITRRRLEQWTEAGINRMSIGCQSFQPRVLEVLNRNHTRQQALSAVELAISDGPEVVSLDLIFGNPDQTVDEWDRDLRVVEQFDGLSHLSAYHLTIEPDTAFHRRVAAGRLSTPNHDRAYAMLDRLTHRSEAMGFRRYEVSNFARPGCRSRHNTLYWTGAEYLGVGVGAHGFHIDPDAGGYRRANPADTAAYLADPYTPDFVERLSARQHFVERLFLGVRTRRGIDWQEIDRQFRAALGQSCLDRARRSLDEMCANQLLECQHQVYAPTDRGLNVADSLARRFVAEFGEVDPGGQ